MMLRWTLRFWVRVKVLWASRSLGVYTVGEYDMLQQPYMLKGRESRREREWRTVLHRTLDRDYSSSLHGLIIQVTCLHVTLVIRGRSVLQDFEQGSSCRRRAMAAVCTARHFTTYWKLCRSWDPVEGVTARGSIHEEEEEEEEGDDEIDDHAIVFRETV